MRSFTRRQHRLLGACVSLFLLFMVATGVLINHSHRLGLDRQPVESPVILDWYGLGAPVGTRHYSVGAHWLSHSGGQWYLDGVPVAGGDGGVGAVAYRDWIVMAGPGSLLILDTNGTLIERVPWDDRDAGAIDRIGRTPPGHIVLSTPQGTWEGDAELLQWTPVDAAPTGTRWSGALSPPGPIEQSISKFRRGTELSLEQVLLDLHSGRILGSWGVFAYDVLSLIMGTLAVSGLVLWWRGRRNGLKPRKGKHGRRPR